MYFITGNKNKFQEASAILGIKLNLEQLDIDLPEIQSMDSREVITHKIKTAFNSHSGPFIVEDMSFSISCLNGFPGPLVKWFNNTLTNTGVAQLVHYYEDHTAETTVSVGYAQSSDSIQIFTSTLKGKIVLPRGSNGFGWDPIFEVEGLGKTLAELSFEEKNKISNRKDAFEKLKDILEKE